MKVTYQSSDRYECRDLERRMRIFLDNFKIEGTSNVICFSTKKGNTGIAPPLYDTIGRVVPLTSKAKIIEVTQDNIIANFDGWIEKHIYVIFPYHGSITW